jgi:leucyl aminopeptidase (aminopeptidase T)
MILRSGGGRYELRLTLGERPWIPDDGLIDEEGVKRGGVVSNLPAGSIYTTVLEDETKGEIHFPRTEDATDVLLRFERGRIVEISAKSGANELEAMFDAHSGQPRRVSHVGLGLNPTLRTPLGWTLVDENMAGCLVVAFGENRYMSGENESSLNVDFELPGTTLEVDGKVIADAGALVV